MRYSRFELLALVLGAAAIVASIFLAPATYPQAAEVTAQLLLVVVLGAALHWGRNGGFLAALLAIAVYVAMRIPLLQEQGLSGDLLTMLGTRAATYGVIGILGGELAARIKYLFAKLEGNALIDHVTGVFSARYAAGAILSGVGQWERYATEFSVVSIDIAPTLLASLRSTRCRQLMRQIANHARNDIRMVDDLAYVGPGAFCVLLPGTDGTGAAVVQERLTSGIRTLIGANPEEVGSAVLHAAADSQALKNLAEHLNPEQIKPPISAPGPDRRAVGADSRQEPVA